MTDLNSLDAQTRCLVQVGNFLQHWAVMESELHRAIGKAFELSDLQMLMLCKNIQLRDKIHILRTALSLSMGTLLDNRLLHDKLLKDLAEYSPTRNMFAHDLFMPTDDGKGVEFMVVRARGKLEFPKVVWGDAEFAAAFAKIDGFTTGLKALGGYFTSDSLVKALLARRDTGLPSPWLFGLAPGSSQTSRLNRFSLRPAVQPVLQQSLKLAKSLRGEE